MLARCLAAQPSRHDPLMRLLDPSQEASLVTALARTVAAAAAHVGWIPKQAILADNAGHLQPAQTGQPEDGSEALCRAIAAEYIESGTGR